MSFKRRGLTILGDQYFHMPPYLDDSLDFPRQYWHVELATSCDEDPLALASKILRNRGERES